MWRLWTDRLYGHGVLGRGWYCGGSGCRRRISRRIVERLVVNEDPATVEVAHIEVVLVVEGGCITHRAEVVQVGRGKRVRPERVIVHSGESGTHVDIVARHHPIGAVERGLPHGCGKSHVMLTNRCSIFRPRIRPQVVRRCGGNAESLHCSRGEDGLRVCVWNRRCRKH